MFRNMQLIFRSYEIQFLSSPCPSVQSICLKLYVKPSPCTGRGISSFPQSSNPKCYANFTRVATKSNMNVCHLNHLSRSHHHHIFSMSLILKEFGRRNTNLSGDFIYFRVSTGCTRQRSCLVPQTTWQTFVQQFLKKKGRLWTWTWSPAKGSTELHRGNDTSPLLPSRRCF